MNRLTNKGHESTGRVGRCESRVSYPYMGYLFLLLASALLGLFVVALAYRSGWAAVAGVALGGCLVAAVVGFRKGAVKLAQSRREGDPRHNVSIFAEPLRQEEVASYLNDMHNVGIQDFDGGDAALLQVGHKLCNEIWDGDPPAELAAADPAEDG